jgi:hypothetical protein
MYEKIIDCKIGMVRAYQIWHTLVYFFALAALHNAKHAKSNISKWKKAANRLVATIRMWVVKHKAINVAHRSQLLEAELLTLKEKQYPDDNMLFEAFDNAIVVASKLGFVQDAALGAALASRAV